MKDSDMTLISVSMLKGGELSCAKHRRPGFFPYIFITTRPFSFESKVKDMSGHCTSFFVVAIYIVTTCLGKWYLNPLLSKVRCFNRCS